MAENEWVSLGGFLFHPEMSGVLTAPYLYTLVKTNIAIEHGPGRSRCIFLLKVRGYSNQRFVSLAEGNWLQGALLYTSTPPTSTHFYLHPRVHYRLDITTYSNICTLAKVTKRLQIWPCLVSMLEIMGRQANLNKGYTNTLFFFSLDFREAKDRCLWRHWPLRYQSPNWRSSRDGCLRCVFGTFLVYWLNCGKTGLSRS